VRWPGGGGSGAMSVRPLPGAVETTGQRSHTYGAENLVAWSQEFAASVGQSQPDADAPPLMPKTKQPGLDNRHRDITGQIEKKNGNTRLKTLRQQYGQNLAPGRRSDMMLRTLRDEAGGKSLSQILKAR
jgi:hypothetical protein